MHFHANHPLFHQAHRDVRATAVRVSVVVGVLLLNSGLGSAAVSGMGLAVGLSLLLVAWLRGTHHRLVPALWWIVLLVVISVMATTLLTVDPQQALTVTTRIACGMTWMLWLGTQIDWADLRGLMLRLGLPVPAVDGLDRSVLHGVLTYREWSSRRDAAQLRLGQPKLPVRVWATLIAEGSWTALDRVEQAEAQARLRGATPRDSPREQVVQAVDLGLQLDDRTLLKDLSLTLGQGEWVALCGPSGAGKTTLLRLLAGVLCPTAGHLNRLGIAIGPRSALAARLDGRVCLLTQNPEHHFVASTVAEDIGWGLRQRGRSSADIDAAVHRVAERLRLTPLLSRPCHQLSVGEQRRAALAGLLVLQPDLLLLDEPTAGLDPVASANLIRLLTELRHTGTTCLWATHDRDSLPPSVERVLLLRDARLVFDGPRSTALSAPWLERAGLALPTSLSDQPPLRAGLIPGEAP
jgi:cobalt/nickel transport system ATP-binding protein